MIIAICGKTAAGKDTIVNSIKRLYSSKEIISHTTRNMRPDEVDGEKYDFCSLDEFISLQNQNKFAEVVEYGGNMYGFLTERVREAEESDEIYTVIAIPDGIHDIEKALGFKLFKAYIEADDDVRKMRYISRLNGNETKQDYIDLEERFKNDNIIFESMKDECNIIIDNSQQLSELEILKIAQGIYDAAVENYVNNN